MLLALAGIARHAPERGLEAEEAARINGRSIPMREWQRAIDAANSARREPLDAAGEAAVLDTLIEQELLLQLAGDLGLAHTLPRVRGRLVEAAMQALAPVQPPPQDEAALRAFYAAQPALFRQAERRQLRAWRHASAEAAAAGQQGEPVTLPTEALDARQMQRWLGASLTQAVFAAPAPGPLPPQAVGEGWYRLEITAIEPAAQPDYADIDQALLARRAAQAAREAELDTALAALKEQAELLRRAAP